MTLALHQLAPDFQLPADDGQTFKLQQLRGKRVLLVFYPADESPVCTAQLCEYRDGIEAFVGLNAEVIGISKQNSLSHQAFKKNRQLPFTLLSDLDLQVAKLYGAVGLMGMKRATFLIDEMGILRWQHIEATALFRRSAEELIGVLKAL